MGVVIEPFPFAGDGFTVEFLKPGDQRDFGSAEQGLIDAGFVAASAATEAVAPDIEAEGETKPRTSRARRTN